MGFFDHFGERAGGEFGVLETTAQPAQFLGQFAERFFQTRDFCAHVDHISKRQPERAASDGQGDSAFGEVSDVCQAFEPGKAFDQRLVAPIGGARLIVELFDHERHIGPGRHVHLCAR